MYKCLISYTTPTSGMCFIGQCYNILWQLLLTPLSRALSSPSANEMIYICWQTEVTIDHGTDG